MSNYNKESDYISLMVEETLGGVSSDSIEIHEFHGRFDFTKQCYVFQFNDQFLEIPENFGFFSYHKDFNYKLNSENDKLLFLMIFSSFYQDDFQSINFQFTNGDVLLSCATQMKPLSVAA